MTELKKFNYFVNNEWKKPVSKEYFQSENPATGRPWALVPDCGCLLYTSPSPRD